MSEEEIFYDSLEENDGGQSEDVTTAVPLYTGETPKSKITHAKKKKVEKPQRLPVISNSKPKSYLSMYYDKQKKIDGIHGGCEGSATTRAIYEKLSPTRDLEIEADLQEVHTPCGNSTDSGQEEFYEQFLSLELEEKKSSARSIKEIQNKSSNSSNRSKSNTGRAFHVRSDAGDIIEKLDTLKKRQQYGIKMSKQNRIRIDELKALRKIKNMK